jgi:hypothetical protein
MNLELKKEDIEFLKIIKDNYLWIKFESLWCKNLVEVFYSFDY